MEMMHASIIAIESMKLFRHVSSFQMDLTNLKIFRPTDTLLTCGRHIRRRRRRGLSQRWRWWRRHGRRIHHRMVHHFHLGNILLPYGRGRGCPDVKLLQRRCRHLGQLRSQGTYLLCSLAEEVEVSNVFMFLVLHHFQGPKTLLVWQEKNLAVLPRHFELLLLLFTTY